MDNFRYVDIFATKGIEYLLIIAFLVSFVMFWIYLNRPAMARETATSSRITTTLLDWFYLANDFHYHKGHTWVKMDTENTAMVGIDDFAQKLLGKPDRVLLPKPGMTLEQGDRGWQVQFDRKLIDILAPINGEVVEINEEVLNSPELINQSPYEKGWLLKVKSKKINQDLKNLLSGNLAKSWIEEVIANIGSTMSEDPHPVLQDGGQLITGFAKEISPGKWDQFARKFLLTEDLD